MFSFPKSIYTVLDALQIMTDKNDIVLDFFAGSGTTGHAMLELNKEDGGNRKFILIEQLDKHIEVCSSRIQKVMETNDSAVYLELKKYNQTFIEQIRQAKNTPMILKIRKRIIEKGFVSHNVDLKNLEEASKEFSALPLKQQKQCLYELLDKNQLYVSLSSLDDQDFACTEFEKATTENFYLMGEK